MADVKYIIKETLTNLTHAQITKPATSPLGMIIAYGCILLMAVFPMVIGAFRSVKFHRIKLKEEKVSARTASKINYIDVIILVISLTLITLFKELKMFSKGNTNLIITTFFYIMGVLASSRLINPVVSNILSKIINNETYNLKYCKGTEELRKILIDFTFTFYDVICPILCALLGVSYFFQNHWIVNNLLSIVFAINGIEMVLLNNVLIGCILFLGFFVYNLLWLFYPDVMTSTTKSIDFPTGLVFPQDILERGLTANNFATLGLCDVVIPGIFIALLLRFDLSLNRYNRKTYFHSSFFGYVLGLVVTVFLVCYYKKGQPALLYVIPTCLLVPVLVALLKKDFETLLKYKDISKDIHKKRDSWKEKSLERTTKKATEDKPKSPRGRTPTRTGRSKSRTRTSPPLTPVTPPRERRRK